jgi:hypothetical protein
MAEEQKLRAWWQTLPGVLTTIVGVITGLTGLVVALQGAGLIGSAPRQSPAPESLCGELAGHSLYIDANSYKGIVGPAGIAILKNADGSFRFDTRIVFNRETNEQFNTVIDDPIVGDCKGTTINFTRNELADASGSSFHRFSGTIVKAASGPVSISGAFRDERNNPFQWSATVENPVPR